MAVTQFNLTTDWTLDASVDRVWNVLIAPEDWPSWWRAVTGVERLVEGDANGIGAVRRMTWRTALPYTLTFDMCTTRIEPKTVIEGRAAGELDGTGRWTLQPSGPRTAVRYEWSVAVTQPWMRTMAPLLRPVFKWNHGVVMEWGRQGLSKKLAMESIPA
jgi:hypothetical protein